MPNALIPRTTVHAWSEAIGNSPMDHSSSLTRLLKDQRRLTRFIEENSQAMGGATAGICVYMTGVIARMFETAGGRLRNATWEHVRAAEARVSAKVDQILPLDLALVDRLHAISDRAQPHILDEAAMVLFLSERAEGEPETDLAEALKVLLVSWVVVEVLNDCWQPPKDFVGEASYTYVHIDPPKAPETPANA